MGCGMSTEEKEGKARNEEIENQLKRDRMQQRNEIKMLLLGMSGCLPGSSPHMRACPQEASKLGSSAGTDRSRLQVLVNPESLQS